MTEHENMVRFLAIVAGVLVMLVMFAAAVLVVPVTSHLLGGTVGRCDGGCAW